MVENNSEYDLQIIIVSGEDNVERAMIGFASALASAASGSKVVIFLTIQGAIWIRADKGNDHLVSGFETIAHFVNTLQEAGAQIEVCTSCAERARQTSSGVLAEIRPNIEMAGLGRAAMRLTSVPTVTF